MPVKNSALQWTGMRPEELVGNGSWESIRGTSGYRAETFEPQRDELGRSDQGVVRTGGNQKSRTKGSVTGSSVVWRHP